MIQDQMPTLEELSLAPELAALAALDSALEAATRALFAANRELCDDRIPRTKLTAVFCAHRVVNLASRIQVALARYRQTVSPYRPVPPNATDDLDALTDENGGPPVAS